MQLLAYALLDCDDAVWPYVTVWCAMGRSARDRPRTRDLDSLPWNKTMMCVKWIQWASQGTDSAIAALEAGECIDTDDEGPREDYAAISPSWILSVFTVIFTF